MVTIMRNKAISIIDLSDEQRGKLLATMLNKQISNKDIHLLINNDDLSRSLELDLIALFIHDGDRTYWEKASNNETISDSLESLIVSAYNSKTTKIFWYSGSEEGISSYKSSLNNDYYISKRVWASDFQLTEADINDIINYTLGISDDFPECCIDYLSKEKLIALCILCQTLKAIRSDPSLFKSSWWLNILLLEEEKKKYTNKQQRMKILTNSLLKHTRIRGEIGTILRLLEKNKLNEVDFSEIEIAYELITRNM
jgi:hypothetical protein